MTDEEKIRYLLGCKDTKATVVVIWRKDEAECEKITLGDVTAIINRQQAEIERLEKELASKNLEYSLLEREKAEDVSGFVNDLKLARAEAIKEFAERLKTNLEYDYCSYSQDLIILINDTEKELVGEQE
jgi:uncharacterized FlaG/YvyC family protein